MERRQGRDFLKRFDHFVVNQAGAASMATLEADPVKWGSR
jgi:hypothetical protein